jgi:hypothetical protein
MAVPLGEERRERPFGDGRRERVETLLVRETPGVLAAVGDVLSPKSPWRAPKTILRGKNTKMSAPSMSAFGCHDTTRPPPSTGTFSSPVISMVRKNALSTHRTKATAAR